MAEDWDVAVAGSGIAGLSAALACARLGRKTLLLTGDTLGGQLLSIARVDAYPGFPEGVPGYELCPMVQEQAAACGAEFAAAAVERIAPADGRWRLAASDGGDHVARAVIVATGASLKPLDVPGAARLAGKGVSHCASCDAPLLRGRVAAVVGGGDSAAQEALTLAEAARRVIVLHRGDRLTAQAAYRERIAAHAKIELRPHSVVEEILGDAGVTGLRVRDRATGAAGVVDSDGVFVYIGLVPNADLLGGLVTRDAAGAVVTDPLMRCASPGLCGVGAVRAGWSGRAVVSAGEGAAAAIAVDRYLADGTWTEAAHG
jgi:thioredoxin reductase (NADPH)